MSRHSLIGNPISLISTYTNDRHSFITLSSPDGLNIADILTKYPTLKYFIFRLTWTDDDSNEEKHAFVSWLGKFQHGNPSVVGIPAHLAHALSIPRATEVSLQLIQPPETPVAYLTLDPLTAADYDIAEANDEYIISNLLQMVTVVNIGSVLPVWIRGSLLRFNVIAEADTAGDETTTSTTTTSSATTRKVLDSPLAILAPNTLVEIRYKASDDSIATYQQHFDHVDDQQQKQQASSAAMEESVTIHDSSKTDEEQQKDKILQQKQNEYIPSFPSVLARIVQLPFGSTTDQHLSTPEPALCENVIYCSQLLYSLLGFTSSSQVTLATLRLQRLARSPTSAKERYKTAITNPHHPQSTYDDEHDNVDPDMISHKSLTHIAHSEPFETQKHQAGWDENRDEESIEKSPQQVHREHVQKQKMEEKLAKTRKVIHPPTPLTPYFNGVITLCQVRVHPLLTGKCIALHSIQRHALLLPVNSMLFISPYHPYLATLNTNTSAIPRILAHSRLNNGYYYQQQQHGMSLSPEFKRHEEYQNQIIKMAIQDTSILALHYPTDDVSITVEPDHKQKGATNQANSHEMQLVKYVSELKTPGVDIQRLHSEYEALSMSSSVTAMMDAYRPTLRIRYAHFCLRPGHEQRPAPPIPRQWVQFSFFMYIATMLKNHQQQQQQQQQKQQQQQQYHRGVPILRAPPLTFSGNNIIAVPLYCSNLTMDDETYVLESYSEFYNTNKSERKDNLPLDTQVFSYQQVNNHTYRAFKVNNRNLLSKEKQNSLYNKMMLSQFFQGHDLDDDSDDDDDDDEDPLLDLYNNMDYTLFYNTGAYIALMVTPTQTNPQHPIPFVVMQPRAIIHPSRAPEADAMSHAQGIPSTSSSNDEEVDGVSSLSDVASPDGTSDGTSNAQANGDDITTALSKKKSKKNHKSLSVIEKKVYPIESVFLLATSLEAAATPATPLPAGDGVSSPSVIPAHRVPEYTVVDTEIDMKSLTSPSSSPQGNAASDHNKHGDDYQFDHDDGDDADDETDSDSSYTKASKSPRNTIQQRILIPTPSNVSVYPPIVIPHLYSDSWQTICPPSPNEDEGAQPGNGLIHFTAEHLSLLYQHPCFLTDRQLMHIYDQFTYASRLTAKISLAKQSQQLSSSSGSKPIAVHKHTIPSTFPLSPRVLLAYIQNPIVLSTPSSPLSGKDYLEALFGSTQTNADHSQLSPVSMSTPVPYHFIRYLYDYPFDASVKQWMTAAIDTLAAMKPYLDSLFHHEPTTQATLTALPVLLGQQDHLPSRLVALPSPSQNPTTIHMAAYTIPTHSILYGSSKSGRTTLASYLGYLLSTHPSIHAFCVYLDCSTLAKASAQLVTAIMKHILNIPKLKHRMTVLILDNLDELCPPAKEEHEDMNLCETVMAHLLSHIHAPQLHQRFPYPVYCIATAKNAAGLHPKLIKQSTMFENHTTLNTPNDLQRKYVLSSQLNAFATSTASLTVRKTKREKLMRSLPVDVLQFISNATEGYTFNDLTLTVHRIVNKMTIASTLKLQEQQQQLQASYYRQQSSTSSSTSTKIRDTTWSLQDITLPLVQSLIAKYTPLPLRGIGLSGKKSMVASGDHKTWSDVGALDSVIHQMRQTFEYPILYPQLFQNSPLKLMSGMLLYGAPGSGKSLLALALQYSTPKLHFIRVKGPEVLDKYVGASEENVRKLFASARNARPCVIFFDDFDSIALKRGSDSNGVTDRVVNQLLVEMDGVKGREGVFVLAATTRPDLIDSALLRPGRLDLSVYCPLPQSVTDREQILRALTGCNLVNKPKDDSDSPHVKTTAGATDNIDSTAASTTAPKDKKSKQSKTAKSKSSSSTLTDDQPITIYNTVSFMKPVFDANGHSNSNPQSSYASAATTPVRKPYRHRYPYVVADDVDFTSIAKRCNNFTGADIAALITNALLVATHIDDEEEDDDDDVKKDTDGNTDDKGRTSTGPHCEFINDIPILSQQHFIDAYEMTPLSLPLTDRQKYQQGYQKFIQAKDSVDALEKFNPNKANRVAMMG